MDSDIVAACGTTLALHGTGISLTLQPVRSSYSGLVRLATEHIYEHRNTVETMTAELVGSGSLTAAQNAFAGAKSARFGNEH